MSWSSSLESIIYSPACEMLEHDKSKVELRGKLEIKTEEIYLYADFARLYFSQGNEEVVCLYECVMCFCLF